MIFESELDNEGIQRIGMCVSCYYPKSCKWCSPTYITCVNDFKRNTAKIYSPAYDKTLDRFSGETLTKGEFVKWCNEHGYAEAKCRR